MPTTPPVDGALSAERRRVLAAHQVDRARYFLDLSRRGMIAPAGATR
jgi:hypothetical protein